MQKCEVKEWSIEKIDKKWFWNKINSCKKWWGAIEIIISKSKEIDRYKAKEKGQDLSNCWW